MAKFIWHVSLNTGIDVIDEQHRRIMLHINDLHQAVETADQSAIGNVLDELVDYTLSHFAFEEGLMAQANYPMLEPHKQVHQQFINKVENFKLRFLQGEDVSQELLTMLHRWLINHIQNEDADYVKSVNDNIVQQGQGLAAKNTSWLKRLFA
ncbi:bacteriohemerythrin [Motilimonas pumila]|uniref:Bacteriohemerythrin n=1 Tax=Motilimonas pumila TaxID=2303987 RepID=A0A418YBI1_9GAMM|nr:bacteriohemerythrin [Motilimonas pumila]RJG40331.1 bacteriohemerythrin [Motilimonas pumila]